jgi:serine/threonine protein kinase/tetratricopeptide (TPR) repeat protein
MVGQTISHYEVVEKLGEGGMGVVYKAHDTKLDRIVALKFLPPHLGSDEAEKKRFLHEAKAASALDHNNICSIYSIEETDNGNIFIVMAYYEGMSLKEKIEQRPLPLKDVVNYSIQIAAGLQKAHEKRIVHRDLKPANIFITNDNQIKIIDFGLAKAAERSLLTKSGTTLGTVPYMSPEQAQGGKVDHRTDIWSLGVVIYEMIAGQRPFRSNYETALVYSIINEDPEPVTGLRSGVPMDFEKIIAKCLEKNPSDRYQHVDEIIIDVRRIDRELSSAIFTKNLKAGMKEVSTSPPSNTESSSKPRPVISILVFENLTGDSTLDPIGRMASDWITQGLTQTGLVEIVPSTSVFAVLREMESEGVTRTGSAGMKYIADVTGAGFVISGAYYKIGSQLQLQSQITNIGVDKLLFVTEPVTGPLDRPTETIELLRQQIMGALSVHLDDRLSDYAGRMRPPASFGAYEYYIEGLERFSNGDLTGAISSFTRTTEIDTEFFMAYGWLAVCYIYQNNYVMADTVVRNVKERRDRLTQLDRVSLHWLEEMIRGDRAGALQAVRTASRHAPGSVSTWVLVSECIRSNRPHEALRVHESINPEIGVTKMMRDLYYGRRTTIYHLIGEHDKELEVSGKFRKMFPDRYAALNIEIRALVALGRTGEIEKLLDESLKLPVHSTGIPGETMQVAGLELLAHGYHEAASGALERTDTPGETMQLAGLELLAHGYPEAASDALEQSLKWYQEQHGEHEYAYARTLYFTGRWDESKTLFEKLASEDRENIDYQGYLGVIAVREGNTNSALSISEWLEKLDRPYLFGSHTLWRARIAARLGEHALSVSLLREAFRQGASYGLWLHRDFDLEPLRDYKPFLELLEPRG